MRVINDLGIPLLYERKVTDIVSIRIIVDIGSTAEEHYEHGAAHFLEHMFFRGTETHNYKEINRITSRLGHINAYTSYDRSVYWMNTLWKDFEEAIAIMAEIICEPRLSSSEFDIEKPVILEEIQTSEDAPTSYFFKKSAELHFGEKGHSILGSKEDIEKMTVDDLICFRSRTYAADRIAVAVVGDIDVEQALKFVHLIINRGISSTSHFINEDPPKINWNDDHFHHPSKQSIIQMTVPGMSEIDNASTKFTWDVLTNAIGVGMHSLLWDRLREELGLCYNVSSYQYRDSMMIYTMLGIENIEQARSEVEKIVKQVSKDGISQDLLEVSRKSVLFNMARQMETAAGTICLLGDEFFRLNRQCIPYQDRVNRILSITNEDIVECAKRLFGGLQKWSVMTQE